MEFNEKLQQLRKEKNLTQEQLAEKLYISRTAISKWESGKGYPNIDSLKNISKLFGVTIDDLLSGEELISIAELENNSNINKIFNLIWSFLDIMALTLVFLPLYGQFDGEVIRMVNLYNFNDASNITRFIYFIVPLSIVLIGILEFAMQYINSKWLNVCKIISVLLQSFAILIFINTRQPYATSLIFVFLMIKVLLFIKRNKI